MAQELFYTSARKGLKLGTRGFCTVAHTVGMAPDLIRLLESLSVYKGFFGGHDEDAYKNPASVCHCRASLRQGPVSILSRIGSAGGDHTNRDNKLAHHIVLEKEDRAPGGPAWLASQTIFAHEWQGAPRLLETSPILPQGDVSSCFAANWEMLTGDAGWGGVAAASFENQPGRPVYVVYEPGMDILPLFAESVATLPAAKRWLVSFNTYFTQLTGGVSCGWRGCLAGMPQLKDLRQIGNALVIDLTRPLGDPPPSHTVQVARGVAMPMVLPRRRPVVGNDDDDPDAEASGSGFKLMRNRRQEKISLRPNPEKRRGDV